MLYQNIDRYLNNNFLPQSRTLWPKYMPLRTPSIPYRIIVIRDPFPNLHRLMGITSIIQDEEHDQGLLPTLSLQFLF